MTKTRKARYDKDNLAFIGFLQERNPFVPDPSLRNIATGVTVDVAVNAHKVKEVGNKIIDSMDGMNTLEYIFTKKRQVVTMGHKFSASVDGETIQVDPQLLFQRLIMVASRVTENVEDIFKYEICGYPASLFDSSGLLREANKPFLADAIWTVGRGTEMSAPEEDGMCNVLDGGSLIQRIPRKRDATFYSICHTYVEYVQRMYNKPVIAFGGYYAGHQPKVDISPENKGCCRCPIELWWRHAFKGQERALLGQQYEQASSSS